MGYDRGRSEAIAEFSSTAPARTPSADESGGNAGSSGAQWCCGDKTNELPETDKEQRGSPSPANDDLGLQREVVVTLSYAAEGTGYLSFSKDDRLTVFPDTEAAGDVNDQFPKYMYAHSSTGSKGWVPSFIADLSGQDAP